MAFRQVAGKPNSVAWFHRLLVWLILLLAFFLRTYQLDAQPLRGDEAATVHYSVMPVTGLWELSRVTDPHPPLYYLALHPWQWLVGEDAWVMRFAGVVASVLVVVVLYRLACRSLGTLSAGLFAAGLIAVNPFQIWLAQDLRSYPFFTLFGLFSSWALWSALHRPKHATPLKLWSLYVISTVTCLYIHYYTVFLIAFQAIFVLLNLKQFWSKKWLWLAAQAAITILIIPGLQLARNFMGQAAGGIDTIPTSDILRLTSTALLTGFTIDAPRGLWISLLLAPVWIMGLIVLLRRSLTLGSFWGLYFAVPVLGVVALSLDRPFFKERFLIQAQPAFALLLAVGFLAWWQFGRSPRLTTHASRFTFYAFRLVALLLLALLVYANLLALNNYFANPTYAKAPPWQLYRDYVRGKARPGDVMLTNFPEAAVSYYSPNALPFYVVPVERDRPVDDRLAQTEQIAGAYERIWFLPLLRQGFDEQGDVLNWLDRHADRVDQIFFPAYHLNLYLSPRVIDDTLINQSATFAHGIALRGFQVFDRDGDSLLSTTGEIPVLTLEPGAEFTVSLYWLADGPTDDAYTVFTHLIAADGFNQAGRDNQPVWGSYPTTAWQPGEKVTDKYTLTLPQGLSPDDYRLRVGWYQSDTLERVPVLAHEDQDQLILNFIIRVTAN